ncbi:MAG: ATPase domain-containing protein [Candidatus Micrarchaeia archaeon]
MAIERVKTGVEGLDDILGGGFPKKRSIIVAGGPGTGKTLFCMQFLYAGAKAGEVGIFISTEEERDRIIENVMAAFPEWADFEKLVEEDRVVITKVEPFPKIATERKWFENLQELIEAFVSQYKASRVAIDSATIIKAGFSSDFDFRKSMVFLLEYVAKLDATVLLTVEMPTAERDGFAFDVEEFLADGVIILYNFPREESRIRALEVLKMRGARHVGKLVPLKFTNSGLRVFPGEKVY